ncbi:MAG: M20/M25/M40 family metallo-hydrolase [Bacteroidetes bacterium]|nr:M20/M25/M40 family metallo-hydrolase [Bacteroidota bacterium]
MKKLILITLLAFLCNLHLLAELRPLVDTSVISKLKTEAVGASKSMALLQTLCDLYGPKPSFSPSLAKAADWISGQMKEIGLKNIHREGWMPKGRSWEVKEFSAGLTSPYYMNLVAYPRMYSPSTRGVIRAEAINLKIASEKELQDYKGALKDKIVLLGDEAKVNLATRPFVTRVADTTLTRLENMTQSTADEKKKEERMQVVNDSLTMEYLKLQSKIIEFCGKEGAALVADIGNRTYGTCQVWTAIATDPAKSIFDWFSKSAFSGNYVPVPQVTISAEQFNALIRTLKKEESVFLEVNLEVKVKNEIQENNLVAEIPGSDLKDEVVMIGAHLDGYQVGTNAVDNNAGVIACLEAMRAIHNLRIQPRRTIRIALWTGEEQGCLGSKAYVATHFTAGGKEKLQAYFNMDNGAGRFRGINAEENPDAKSLFKSWMQQINDPKFQTACIQRVDHTDHWAFTSAGLPGFQFIQDPLDYYRTYHTNMDVPERVPADDLKQNAFLMAAFAWLAANMEGPIQK